MFTKKITDADAFTTLPPSTQALYLHLCMGADDDGFSNKIRQAMFNAHADQTDFQLLVQKRFVIPFDDKGVVVIKHWRMHNIIRNDRYHETEFLEEKSRLLLEENGIYKLGIPYDNQVTTIGIPNDNQMETEVRLGKDRIGKVSKGKDNIKTYAPTYNESEPALYDLPTNKNDTFFPVTQKDIEEWHNLYPAVDIDQQIRNMLGWLKSNPTKRKTMNGMPRFINSWLSKEQDRYHPTAPGKKKGHDLEDTYSAIRDWAASKEDT